MTTQSSSLPACLLVLGAAAPVATAPADVPTNPARVPKSDQVLSVATYNVQLLPFPKSSHNSGRAKLIPQHLKDFDVVVFNEAFDDGPRAQLLDGMRRYGFRHSTWILGSAFKDAKNRKTDTVYGQRRPIDGRPTERTRRDYRKAGGGDFPRVSIDGRLRINVQDGGVIIVSKYPLSQPKELVFKACDGSDCAALKGFIYAKLAKGKSTYHVVGTHPQAYGYKYPSNEQETRRKQFRRIWEFIAKESEIPQSQPVIIAGDFNVRRGTHEYGEVMGLDVLNCNLPDFIPATGDNAKTSGSGWLDYVVTKKTWKKPTVAVNRLFKAQGKYGGRIQDLSDHHPVWGYLDFRP